MPLTLSSESVNVVEFGSSICRQNRYGKGGEIKSENLNRAELIW